MEDNQTTEDEARCLQCGLSFIPSACERGYCPDCRLADILLKDDRLPPDFQGQIGIRAKTLPADNR
jgi:hypothetical protein